jgi:hypothetical protein
MGIFLVKKILIIVGLMLYSLSSASQTSFQDIALTNINSEDQGILKIPNPWYTLECSDKGHCHPRDKNVIFMWGEDKYQNEIDFTHDKINESDLLGLYIQAQSFGSSSMGNLIYIKDDMLTTEDDLDTILEYVELTDEDVKYPRDITKEELRVFVSYHELGHVINPFPSSSEKHKNEVFSDVSAILWIMKKSILEEERLRNLIGYIRDYRTNNLVISVDVDHYSNEELKYIEENYSTIKKTIQTQNVVEWVNYSKEIVKRMN